MIVVRQGYGAYGQDATVPQGDKPPATPLPDEITSVVAQSNAAPAALRADVAAGVQSQVPMGAPVEGDLDQPDVASVLDPGVGNGVQGAQGTVGAPAPPAAAAAAPRGSWWSRNKWTILAVGGGTVLLTTVVIIVAAVATGKKEQAPRG